MGKRISEYVGSDEFNDKMRKVSAKSRPFGNSTPSNKVFEALVDASSKRAKAACK